METTVAKDTKSSLVNKLIVYPISWDNTEKWNTIKFEFNKHKVCTNPGTAIDFTDNKKKVDLKIIFAKMPDGKWNYGYDVTNGTSGGNKPVTGKGVFANQIRAIKTALSWIIYKKYFAGNPFENEIEKLQTFIEEKIDETEIETEEQPLILDFDNDVFLPKSYWENIIFEFEKNTKTVKNSNKIINAKTVFELYTKGYKSYIMIEIAKLEYGYDYGYQVIYPGIETERVFIYQNAQTKNFSTARTALQHALVYVRNKYFNYNEEIKPFFEEAIQKTLDAPDQDKPKITNAKIDVVKTKVKKSSGALGFRENWNTKKKAKRWLKNLKQMPDHQRSLILKEIHEAYFSNQIKLEL